jgi:hypothetical protein
MTTGRIPYNDEAFMVNFDFINHILSVRTSTNKLQVMQLRPQSVADFYREFMRVLADLGIRVDIWPVPVELPEDPIPFEQDTKHAAYDSPWVTRWWRVMLRSAFVFDHFRSPFRGKNSPHHFFWGGFDLTGTRFSGRPAKPPPAKGVMKRIMDYAENEENFGYGFWPGDINYPHPAYFVYMVPKPDGFEKINVGKRASYNKKLGQFLYPYEELHRTATPAKELLDYLNTLYAQGAKLAGWDVRSFESPVPPIHHK